MSATILCGCYRIICYYIFALSWLLLCAALVVISAYPAKGLGPLARIRLGPDSKVLRTFTYLQEHSLERPFRCLYFTLHCTCVVLLRAGLSGLIVCSSCNSYICMILCRDHLLFVVFFTAHCAAAIAISTIFVFIVQAIIVC